MNENWRCPVCTTCYAPGFEKNAHIHWHITKARQNALDFNEAMQSAFGAYGPRVLVPKVPRLHSLWRFQNDRT